MGKHRSAEQMQALLSEHSVSGLSKKAFCELKGIDPAVFYYWQRRLSTTEVEQSCFTELKVSKSYEVELNLGKGTWVGLRSQSLATLAGLIEALRRSDA